MSISRKKSSQARVTRDAASRKGSVQTHHYTTGDVRAALKKASAREQKYFRQGGRLGGDAA